MNNYNCGAHERMHMPMDKFQRDCCIRGCHQRQAVWVAAAGEPLECVRGVELLEQTYFHMSFPVSVLCRCQACPG